MSYEEDRKDNSEVKEKIRKLSLVATNSLKVKGPKKLILGETELALLGLAVETINDLWRMIEGQQK